MKKSWKIPCIIFLFFSCLISMGVDYHESWLKTLEDFPVLDMETRTFSIPPKIYIFSNEYGDGFEPYILRNPIYVQNNRALVSMEDLESILQNKKISFNWETQVISIQQMKRVYMAIDKSAYFEQEQLKPLPVAPRIKDGKVYLPLRFIMEKMGYCVNYNQSESEILLVSNDETQREIIPKEKIDLKKVEEEDNIIKKTNVLVYDEQSFLGIVEDQEENFFRLARIDEKGKIKTSQESILGPKFKIFSGEASSYYGQNSNNLYFLDLQRGLFTEFEIPKMLKQATFFGVDLGKYYAYNGNHIFSYEINSRVISKVLKVGSVEDLFIDNEKLYFNQDGNLRSYSLVNNKSKTIDTLSDTKMLDIFDVSYPYIYYFNYDRSVFVVYNELEGKNLLTIPFQENTKPNINITNNQYITVGDNQKLDLYEIIRKSHRSFDLVNLKEEINRGLISWYWDGSFLQGYWKYKIDLEQKIDDQVIRINL